VAISQFIPGATTCLSFLASSMFIPLQIGVKREKRCCRVEGGSLLVVDVRSVINNVD
jgi:putative effector of murein hydrolase LrgA (UPF0299 family)